MENHALNHAISIEELGKLPVTRWKRKAAIPFS
jgi:hypothetical protein